MQILHVGASGCTEYKHVLYWQRCVFCQQCCPTILLVRELTSVYTSAPEVRIVIAVAATLHRVGRQDVSHLSLLFLGEDDVAACEVLEVPFLASDDNRRSSALRRAYTQAEGTHAEPGSGMTLSPREATHPIQSCAGVQPFLAARDLIASAIIRLWRRFYEQVLGTMSASTVWHVCLPPPGSGSDARGRLSLRENNDSMSTSAEDLTRNHAHDLCLRSSCSFR